jgi:hypothetical protein
MAAARGSLHSNSEEPTMTRLRLLVAASAALLVAVSVDAQTPKPKATTKAPPTTAAAPALATAHGEVGKAEKDALTVKPRGAQGRFEKDLVLQVTGTSKVTVLTMQTRAGKSVPVQQEADVKDLKPQQSVAVIYTQTAAGPVLLSAVALPANAP